MHSSDNMIYDTTYAKFIKAGYEYTDVQYNRWKTVLLKHPYKTDCIDYNMDGSTQHRMRSDCILHCIHNDINQLCTNSDQTDDKPYDQCIHPLNHWKKQLIGENRLGHLKFCKTMSTNLTTFTTSSNSSVQDNCIFSNYYKVENMCKVKCKQNC